MTELDDLARQVAEIRTTLGMEHEPPLDRLSLIDLKIETVRTLVQQLGLSIGDQQRLLTLIEARQLEHGRSLDRLAGLEARVAETQAGVAAILAILQGGAE